MNTLEKLKILCNYYYTTRRAGHTYLMVHGIGNSDRDYILLGATQRHIDGIIENFSLQTKNIHKISLYNLEKLEGLSYPIALDNYTIFSILQEAAEEIEKLQKMIPLEKREKR